MKTPSHLVIHDYKNNQFFEPLTAAELFEAVTLLICFFAIIGISIFIYLLMAA